jgi:methyl-accepting chemotaxis protein
MNVTADDSRIATLTTRAEKLRGDYAARRDHWSTTLSDGAARRALIQDSDPAAQEFFAIFDTAYVPAVKRHDATAVRAQLARLSKAYDRHRAGIDRIVEAAATSNAALEAQATAAIRTTVMLLLLIATAIAAGLVVGGVTIRTGLVRAIDTILDATERLAGGDLTVRLEATGTDELSRVLDRWARLSLLCVPPLKRLRATRAR